MKKGLLSCLKYLNTELRLYVSDVNSRFDYWHALVAWLPAATLALPSNHSLALYASLLSRSLPPDSLTTKPFQFHLYLWQHRELLIWREQL